MSKGQPRADSRTQKVIPYKEYTASREAERRLLTTSKSTSGEEKNWDEEPSLAPCETPSGAKSMAPSQEDEWKFMVNQDPGSGSVAWDSGHGTMAATGEDEPINSTEELVGAVGGIDESVTAEHSLMSNGEMMTLRMSPSPKHWLLLQPQFRHGKKTKLFPRSNHPLGRSFASES